MIEARDTRFGVVEYLTAESERGRRALQEVMQRSYAADIGTVPAAWARARIVDTSPVSFVLVDPNREMAFPGGSLRYGFICDVATRADRRREGHFRAIVEHILASLAQSGIALALTHGLGSLYRPLGFSVFTHHCGIFIAPGQIERALGSVVPDGARQLLVVEEGAHLREDLVVVRRVRARTPAACKAALLAAAAVAWERGKERILFEHPPVLSSGSRYAIHPTPETSLAALARACGGQLRVCGSDPEGRAVPHADWIKVLDAARLVKDAARCLTGLKPALPPGRACFDTDAGTVTVDTTHGELVVLADRTPESAVLSWPSSALAQLVSGYRSAAALCAIHGTPLEAGTLALLDALFPPCWRFSRNESWTFRAQSRTNGVAGCRLLVPGQRLCPPHPPWRDTSEVLY